MYHNLSSTKSNRLHMQAKLRRTHVIIDAKILASIFYLIITYFISFFDFILTFYFKFVEYVISTNAIFNAITSLSVFLGNLLKQLHI